MQISAQFEAINADNAAQWLRKEPADGSIVMPSTLELVADPCTSSMSAPDANDDFSSRTISGFRVPASLLNRAGAPATAIPDSKPAPAAAPATSLSGRFDSSTSASSASKSMLKKMAKGAVFCRSGKCCMGPPVRGKLLAADRDKVMMELAVPVPQGTEMEIEITGYSCRKGFTVRGTVVESWSNDKVHWNTTCTLERSLTYEQTATLVR